MPRRGGSVHVVTTTRRYKGRVYSTHLLRRSYREDGKVKNETLGNLSHLPDSVIELIRRALRGETLLPADELLAGGLIVVGGLLLVTPGLLTDVVGLALLLPFVRSRVVVWIKDFMRRKIQEGHVHIVTLEERE